MSKFTYGKPCENQDGMPEGYTALESIERIPQRIFLLPGFNDCKLVEERSREISGKNTTSFPIIPFKISITEFAIQLPEDAIQFLTEEEKQKLIDPMPNLEPCEHIPMLYRHIDKQFIEEFFKYGKLKLTTYKRCKNIEDTIRRDADEGKTTLETKEEGNTIQIGYGVVGCIMLCLSLSKEYTSSKGEKSECCIEIQNVYDFTYLITDQLLQNGIKVKSVLKGPCCYNDRNIQRQINTTAIKKMEEQMSKGTSSDFNLLFDTAGAIDQNDAYFSKPVEKSVENEYRIVWILDEEPKEENYFVEIPAAIPFCRSVNS